MATELEKPVRLFVSHISEEAEVAALLKTTMEEDFRPLAEFFTSSDVGSIGAGEDWLDAIKRAMGDAAAVIVLCSKGSVQRPWVQFELGAAWMKHVPIIPVCHSGMKVADLPMPLSRLQGVELGTATGIERLYQGVAGALKLKLAPRPRELPELLRRIAALEENFRQTHVLQFERFIDIVIPRPGRLDGETIPDDAVVESDEDTLELFGFIAGPTRTWRDIVAAARRTPDTRWLGQLQRCVCQVSRDELFRPVQAVYHTDRGSFQPQLSKKEIQSNGSCRFHVHLVETVVAPLFEVQNDFGLLATLLRLGLRFRYEVIERFQRLIRSGQGAGNRVNVDEVLRQLRAAIEVIENDAMSRGAENIDRDAVAALFDQSDDQDNMAQIQDQWDVARALLFGTDSPTTQQLVEVIRAMRRINYRFMALGTRRFHEMVEARWSGGAADDPPVMRAA